MSDELKPCPMCGSADLFICPDEYGSGGQHVLPYRVGCKCCGLELYHLAGDSEESAAAQWNARADSPDLATLRAQLADTRAELADVLRDWNALVAASGSPTNGGAVGYVSGIRAQLADALRERDEYERLLDFAADKGARLLGERDAALANVAVLRDALLVAARSAEALKRECGMDPESPQAVRNSEYMNISYAARNALEKTR